MLLTPLIERSPVRRRVNLVYRLPSQAPLARQTSRLVDWTVATPAVIQVMMAQDPRRRTLMLNYLRQGYTGVILHLDLEWVAYGWLARPRDPSPPHVPQGYGPALAQWIFNCCTREPYRNRGLYKEVLYLLAGLAQETPGRVPLYIDTHPGNFPSRRAIRSVGFEASGVLTTWIVGLPGVGWWRWAFYQPQRHHPRL